MEPRPGFASARTARSGRNQERPGRGFRANEQHSTRPMSPGGADAAIEIAIGPEYDSPRSTNGAIDRKARSGDELVLGVIQRSVIRIGHDDRFQLRSERGDEIRELEPGAVHSGEDYDGEQMRHAGLGSLSGITTRRIAIPAYAPAKANASARSEP